MLLAFGSAGGGPIESEGLDLSNLSAAQRVAPAVDTTGLDAVAAAAGGSVLAASTGDDDVALLGRRIRSHLVNAIERDEALAWSDRGYPLVWAIGFCMLFWFRRGWTVQWRL